MCRAIIKISWTYNTVFDVDLFSKTFEIVKQSLTNYIRFLGIPQFMELLSVNLEAEVFCLLYNSEDPHKTIETFAEEMVTVNT